MKGRLSYFWGNDVSSGGCIYATILVAAKPGIFRDIRNYIGCVEDTFLGKKNIFKSIMEELKDIREKISKGDLRAAISDFIRITKKEKDIHKKVLSLSSEFERWNNNFVLGFKPNEEQINRITYSLLEILNDYERPASKVLFINKKNKTVVLSITISTITIAFMYVIFLVFNSSTKAKKEFGFNIPEQENKISLILEIKKIGVYRSFYAPAKLSIGELKKSIIDFYDLNKEFNYPQHIELMADNKEIEMDSLSLTAAGLKNNGKNLGYPKINSFLVKNVD